MLLECIDSLNIAIISTFLHFLSNLLFMCTIVFFLSLLGT